MRRLIVVAALAAVCAALMFAQAPGPQPKSQEEVTAVMAIQNATDADVRIAAAQTLLTDFPDTEFKEMANFMMMLAHQQKDDFENMLLYGDRTLQANPESVGALISLAYAIPLRTREFDLDKDEKLTKAEGYARRALVLIPTLPKPDTAILDDEWLLARKGLMSQAHESLGMVALLRDDNAGAEQSFRQALNVADKQEAQLFYRLSESLLKQGKFDEALPMAEKAVSLGGFMVGGKDAAAALKARIEQAQAAGSPAP